MIRLRYNRITRDEFEAIEGERCGCIEGKEERGCIACIRCDGRLLSIELPLGENLKSASAVCEFPDGVIVCVAYGSVCRIENGVCRNFEMGRIGQVAVGRLHIAVANDTDILVFEEGRFWKSGQVSYDGIEELSVDDISGSIQALGYNAPECAMTRIVISTVTRLPVQSAYP